MRALAFVLSTNCQLIKSSTITRVLIVALVGPLPPFLSLSLWGRGNRAYYKVSALVSVCQTDLQTPDSEQISFCNNFDGQKQVQKNKKPHCTLNWNHCEEFTYIPSLHSLSLCHFSCPFTASSPPQCCQLIFWLVVSVFVVFFAHFAVDSWHSAVLCSEWRKKRIQHWIQANSQLQTTTLHGFPSSVSLSLTLTALCWQLVFW